MIHLFCTSGRCARVANSRCGYLRISTHSWKPKGHHRALFSVKPVAVILQPADGCLRTHPLDLWFSSLWLDGLRHEAVDRHVAAATERVAPMVDVLPAKAHSQLSHASALFRNRHLQGNANSIRDRASVIGINQQRTLTQLERGSGKLAEDEHAVVVNARGAVFFGNQVHAIFERSNQGDVCGTVVRQQFGTIERAVNVLYRRPSRLAKMAIDLAHHSLNLGLEFPIPGNIFAAGNHHLDHRNFAVLFRMQLKKVAKCRQSLRNALGVIEPVDSQQETPTLHVLCNLGSPGRNLFVGRSTGKLLEVDADREMPRQG